MKINIRTSYDSFRRLRVSGAYYVDKTEMIADYLVNRYEKAVMFTRPRRFGKTVTMTMFRDFLDIRQDSSDIFAGLRIMEYPDVIKNYMNQYPVVFLSLKEVYGKDFNAVLENFRIAISKLFEDNSFLMDSTKVSTVSKAFFEKLWIQEGNQGNTERALDLLSSMLRQHFAKPVFVIIDEYDVPMAKALGTPYYDQVRDMIEHMLSYICKTNDNINGVILSGCLYALRNSTYTGVNNIIPYTVLSPVYAASIGFTDADVRKILEDAGLSEQYDMVTNWYDGYIFGRDKMYCPWDVLSFVRSVLDGSYSEAMGPRCYWINTSETTLVQGLLGKSAGINESFERLLAGECIDCTVNAFVPYHRIHENEANLWSALVETGYLTKAVTGRPPLMPLRIPSRSIQTVFRKEVWNYFNDKVDNSYVHDLANALWAGEISRAEGAMNQILEAIISFYQEYHEYTYHLILVGFFTGLGYRVQSERETGYGRSDLMILDPARRRCLILELKHVQKEGAMEAALKEASSQLIQKKYDSQLKYEGYQTLLQYGMAFFDKKTIIARV